MARAVLRYGAIVPPIFRLELQSALGTAIRAKRLNAEEALCLLRDVDLLGFDVDIQSAALPFEAGFALAQRLKLTPYDASYLELALRRSCRLMTRDLELRSAAAELGVLWQ